MDELLPIGRFARLTGLSVKALRHYDEIGLLRPASVDEANGHRRYGLGQAGEAEAVRRLRELELPLEEVRRALAGDAAVLAEHRERLAGRVDDLVGVLARLDRVIDGKEPLVPGHEDVLYRVEVRELSDQPVESVRRRVRSADVATAVEQALRELPRATAGPAFAIVPFADEDDRVELEVCVPVEAAERVVPGCRGVCLQLRGPRLEGPAAPSRVLEHWFADAGVELAGDPREIYVGERELEIVWPFSGEPRPPDPARRFERRVGADR